MCCKRFEPCEMFKIQIIISSGRISIPPLSLLSSIKDQKKPSSPPPPFNPPPRHPPNHCTASISTSLELTPSPFPRLFKLLNYSLMLFPFKNNFGFKGF